MRVISVNVNGIRSAANKGFFAWLDQQNADVICLQEVRAQDEQLTDQLFNPHGYKRYTHVATTKKGYSGVAIYSKREPDNIKIGLGWDVADQEGRYIEATFGKLHIASIYLPSGTSGDERQAIKYEFLDHYIEVLKQQLSTKEDFIICGDWNIAHKNIDLKNWRSNQDKSGFLPEERAWLDKVFGDVGFVDAFRHANPEKVAYTWWSNRGQAWANDTGWRIDYHVVTPSIASKITHSSVYREQKFSDHAPLIMDYAI